MQARTHAWTLHLGRRTPHDRIPLTSPLIRPFDRKLLCCCARTPHVQWDAWDHLRVRPFARMRRPFAHMLAAFSLPPFSRFFARCSSFAHPHAHSHFFRASFACSIVGGAHPHAHSHFFRASFACSIVVRPHTRTFIRAVIRMLIGCSSAHSHFHSCCRSRAQSSVMPSEVVVRLTSSSSPLEALRCARYCAPLFRCRPSVVRLVVGTSLFMWM